MSTFHLDFTKVPTFEKSVSILKRDVFERFPDLVSIDDISERIYGCCRLNLRNSDIKFPMYLEKVNLRSSINELVSISEIIKENRLDKFQEAIIEKTDIPMLHFFRILRAINFHINSIDSSFCEIETNWVNNVTGLDVPDSTMTYKLLIISNCDFYLLKKSIMSNKYKNEELEFLANWVNTHQKIWGINYLVELTLYQMCELIRKGIKNEC
jgi:hypothetical protein